MDGSLVGVLKIRKDLIPCAWILGVVHEKDMYNHPIEYLCISIILRVEGDRFDELHVQQ